MPCLEEVCRATIPSHSSLTVKRMSEAHTHMCVCTNMYICLYEYNLVKKFLRNKKHSLQNVNQWIRKHKGLKLPELIWMNPREEDHWCQQPCSPLPWCLTKFLARASWTLVPLTKWSSSCSFLSQQAILTVNLRRGVCMCGTYICIYPSVYHSPTAWFDAGKKGKSWKNQHRRTQPSPVGSGILFCGFHVINLNCLFTVRWTGLKKPANAR